ncbi:MAG: iron ABC transporter permease [Actinomycetota bacterium]
MTTELRPSADLAELPTGARLEVRAVAAAVVVIVIAAVASMAIGPADIGVMQVAKELLDGVPFLEFDSGLSTTEAAIVEKIRLPRLVLGLMVGSLLAMSGAAYQGSFRNPLADPYLLGIAAGAGLGATIVITQRLGDGAGFFDPVPLAAFAGGLGAVWLSYTAGRLAGNTTVSLVLAGVAVASFLTACQTFVLQSNADAIQEVYAWILGRIATSGWGEPLLLLPYFVVTSAVVLRYRRALDVLAVGDEEAMALGMRPNRIRLAVVLAASLGTSAAVAVSGLIGFVGIIVPHTVRLIFGASHRVLLPLSILFGAAFMVSADLVARTVLEPAELPIGVVTAFIGAPFFALVLRSSRREVW